MPHLYLHIPFCKQACHYCDFHFSTSAKNKNELIQAMMKELVMRKSELPSPKLETIYFGGGTPSLLDEDDLELIFETIRNNFDVTPNAEITLEANPDDITKEYARLLRSLGVNRLSIGIQSFRDDDLRTMNRAHNAEEAIQSVKNAQAVGITNLTIDLIYGIPGLSNEAWLQNLTWAEELGVQHLSSYCLTVEPRTALADMVKKGKAKAVNEEESAQHFELLMKFAAEKNFDHYEISNFAKEGFISRHNSSYWFYEPYLGLGPSAHSYDGKTRRWNIRNNPEFIRLLAAGKPAFESEVLGEKEMFNEMIMVGLRTKWGISTDGIRDKFGEKMAAHLAAHSGKWLADGFLTEKDGRLFTSQRGKLLADHIASDLFLV